MTQTRPTHVPAELYREIDLATFAQGAEDPYLAVKRLHELPDIFYASGAFRSQPGWVISRHADLQDVYMHQELFSNVGGSGLYEVTGLRFVPLEADPPDHGPMRALIQPWFTPEAVVAREPEVRRTACELISKFEDKGGCEFVAEYANRLPSYIILGIIGMPLDDLPQFLVWEHQYMYGATPQEQVQGILSIVDYIGQRVTENESNPGNNLISYLIRSELNGQRLSHKDVVAFIVNLHVAGLDTVVSSLGWHFRHLARNPALQARLRANPADIPLAVTELLRAYSVTTGMPRVVKKDCVFKGIQMRAGDLVTLYPQIAGRDPRAFDNPDQIELGRRAPGLSFGRGAHFCLGVHLARSELRITLEEFLARFSNIRIPEDESTPWHLGPGWGLDRLPLVWDRA